MNTSSVAKGPGDHPVGSSPGNRVEESGRTRGKTADSGVYPPEIPLGPSGEETDLVGSGSVAVGEKCRRGTCPGEMGGVD